MANRPPPAAYGLHRTKFGDIVFPGEMHRLLLVGRHFIHEYPHSPGGAVEKLGRAVIRCTVDALFHATFPSYPGLYPGAMNKLLSYAELQATLPFTHPSAGTFPAFIVRWEQEKRGKVLSGEKVQIEFLEDQAQSFALSDVAVTSNDTAIGASAAQLKQQLASVQAQLQLTPTDLTLFDAVDQSVTAVLGYRDTVTLYGNRYATQVAHTFSLLAQLDRATSLQDARAWPVVSVIRQLQAQCIGIQKDLQAKRQTLQIYTVPSTQSLAQISGTLYGDASHQSDLLALNNTPDPFQVQAGTQLVYYPPTASQRAQQRAF